MSGERVCDAVESDDDKTAFQNHTRRLQYPVPRPTETPKHRQCFLTPTASNRQPQHCPPSARRCSVAVEFHEEECRACERLAESLQRRCHLAIAGCADGRDLYITEKYTNMLFLNNETAILTKTVEQFL